LRWHTAAHTALHRPRRRRLEVIYNHVILVLTGVSAGAAGRRIVALLGANGGRHRYDLKASPPAADVERGYVPRGRSMPRRAGRRPHAQHTWCGALHPVMAGPPLLRQSHCRGNLRPRLLPAGQARQMPRSGEGLPLFPAASRSCVTSPVRLQPRGGEHLLLRSPRPDSRPQTSCSTSRRWALSRISSRRSSRSSGTSTSARKVRSCGSANTNVGLALRPLRLHP